GWEVVRQVDNPLGLVAPEASLGLVLTNGTTTRWVMISREHAVDAQGHELPNAFGDSGSADDPGKAYSRFEDWLASMVELQGGPRTQPLVTVAAQDTPQPRPGAHLCA